ncbi:MAG: SIR2 family NAD-dependent protein deacylase [Bacteroidota bacterium]
MTNYIEKAARKILDARHTVVYTGAGVSVESGIPPFRGDKGLWNKYDPEVLDLTYFKENTQDSWAVIKQIFYDYFGKAKPNSAHRILADWEKRGHIHSVITQNIDNLHSEAGSRNVIEFHGTSGSFVCMGCGRIIPTSDISLSGKAPVCDKCGSLLKPNFIFFGEQIPEPAGSMAFAEAAKSDLFIIVGSTGEVIPASWIPREAKKKGAYIIEINTDISGFTGNTTDLFLEGRAGEIFPEIDKQIKHLSQ